MSDPRQAEWEAWEADQLAKRICPHSGEILLFDHPHSDAPPGRMSCALCDCFGFDPAKVGT